MAVKIGRWDCPTCGHVGVLGPEIACPNCGASRPQDVRFYLPEDAETVTDEAAIQRSRAGADWICGHCSSQNPVSEIMCRSCGNPRDEDSDDRAVEERQYAPGQVPTSSVTRKKTLHPEEQAPQQPKRLRRLILLTLLGLVLVGAGGAIPVGVVVTVDDFLWERTIQILHREAVTHEDWNIPQEAFDVESFRALHHHDKVFRGYETRTRTERVQVGTKRVKCGTVDRGNGYFEDVYCDEPVYESREVEYEEEVYDQVPVYATKHRYKVWEWVSRQEYLLQSKGQDHDPHWPSTNAYRNDAQFREGGRQGHYQVVVTRPNGTQHLEIIPLDQWESLDHGSTLNGSKALLWGWWYGLK